MRGIYIGFPHRGTKFGGVDRVNNAIAELVRRDFELVDSPDRAALQIHSHRWDASAAPARLFVDHGSFADAGFWAYSAPKLRCQDTLLVSSAVCEAIAGRMFDEARPTLRRIPLFADTSVFRPASDRARLREELADRALVPGEGPLLLTASAYSRNKNLHLAIRLLAEVSVDLPGAHLALVGSPNENQQPYRQYLERLARDEGLQERVHFLPNMPYGELADLMRASDALVHLTTCRIENFGLVVAEALAAGLPVLAADWGGLRDLVEHDARGYLAPTWLTPRGPRVDWRGLVPATLRLLTDPALRERMSANSVEFARARLSLDAFEKRYRETLGELLAGAQSDRGPVKLSAFGQELMFATIQLHMKNPDIDKTSDESRAMLTEHPELWRRLMGPAATSEQPPRAEPGVRAYPADPLWSEGSTLSKAEQRLLASADGRRLSEIARDLQVSVEKGCELAQPLFDNGTLGSLVER